MKGLSSGSDLELALNILNKLTESIHLELDGFEQELLHDLDIVESDQKLYESWKSAKDSSLVESYSLHLLDMLNDVKLMSKIKENELKS